MKLHVEINSRLRAGARVVLVEESDEQLALESAKVAAKQFAPITVKGAASDDLMEALATHKDGTGTLILCDVLRAHGGNPVMARIIREVALHVPKTGQASSRLILLEVPGVDVPQAIRGDIEYLIPKMPSVKELDAELGNFLEGQEIKIAGNGENRHAIASAVAGLSRHEAVRLFSRCYIDKQKLDPVWLRTEKAIRVSERLGGALTFVDTDVPDIGGMEFLKAWLDSRKSAFGSEKAKEFGLPEPKGVILLGPPGTGKSLSAKTVASQWGAPLLRWDIGKMFGSLVGQSEAQTRLAIEAVEACAPCVVWLDEMEKGLSSNGGLDGGTTQRVFGTILTWLQEKTKPVFVVATANNVAALPPELLRKGRFDEIFFVDLPSAADRVEIARIHLNRRERKLDPKAIASITEGFSGAEIEQAIIEGMFTAFAAKRDVTVADITAAIRGTTPLSKTMEEQIARLRTWAKGRAKFASTQIGEDIGNELGKRRVEALR